MALERIDVIGVPVDCVNMTEAIDAVDSMMAGNKPCTIIAVNPEKAIKARKSPQLFNWINNASLILPDGVGIVLAAKWLKNIKIERVPGAELMPAICAHSVKKGYKLFLYGASKETVEKAVSLLKTTYTDINIVGYQDGYLPEAQMPGLIDQINQSQANIIFVALGSPRQEMWMDSYLGKLDNIRVCQGVGGTFDVIAGKVKRAPQLFINLNCEWLYRLISQPTRFMRQIALLKFVFLTLLALIRKR